ncbi:hypothetical protein B1C78_10460 [Thioalkalivibrio denitrificans]|uniref:Uncharacterized protein n=1 Tax=Thioalkalivibrio denitrificans TaxID=108003 RepID=A0A1V3NF06_9GAMM|nr:hypothetical protein [Thioalkalivibrio denitrificans]OOG23699.1 hypothetical protein B1C78_10460 [Thioalkalivibrio denitrificans]
MPRLTALSFAALILLVLLGWLLQPRLASLLGDDGQPLIWLAEAGGDCDLHTGPCRVSLEDGGWVELSIEPRPIRMLYPFTMEVRHEGVDAETVAVDFSGVEMEMGFNRPRLQPVAPGLFRGDGLLPMCVLDRMTWRVQVLMDGEAGRGVAVYHFETTRN